MTLLETCFRTACSHRSWRSQRSARVALLLLRLLFLLLIQLLSPVLLHSPFALISMISTISVAISMPLLNFVDDDDDVMMITTS